jgi:hypothetical protein
MKTPAWLTKPRKLRHIHAGLTIAWTVMIPVSVFTDLKNSVPFLVIISLWALVGAHWAAWQGVRAEEESQKP